MSKKSDIKELLEDNYSIPDIMEELDVSRSYVSTVKGEIKKSRKNSKGTSETEGDNLDGDNQRNSSRSGSEMEGDQDNLESEGKEPKPDKSGKMGGVQKVKPEALEEKTEEKEVDKEWMKKIKNSWKLILSASIGLMLLVGAILLGSKMPVKEDQPTRPSRLNVRSLGR